MYFKIVFQEILTFAQSIVSHRGTMLFAFCVYVCGFAAYSVLQPVRTISTSAFLVIYSIHALCGLFCCLAASAQHLISRGFLVVLVMFILPRLLVSPMFPWLSDDALRYLWDGNILLHGMNPYLVSPSSTEAAFMRGIEPALYKLLDYTDVTSIYPPLAEYTFAVCVCLGKWCSPQWEAEYFVWKAVLCVSECIGFWFMYRTVQHLQRSLIPLWMYVFMPLPVLEIAGQGHLDGLLCAPMGAIVFILARQMNTRPSILSTAQTSLLTNISFTKISSAKISSAQSLLLGCLCAVLGIIKIFPAIIFVPILRFLPVKARLYAALGFGVTTVLVCLPLLHDTATIVHFSTLARNNALSWQFNGAPYYALCYLAAWLHLPTYWLWMPLVFSYVRGLFVVMSAFLPKVQATEIFTALALPLCVIILLSPKVHTWYCVPLLMINICIGWKWLPLLASGLMLSYSYYVAVPPQEQYVLEMLIWGIASIFLVGEWLCARNRSVK
jgi:hypothetical protein